MTTQPLPLSSNVHQRFKRPAFTALAALAMASLGACAGTGGPTPTQAQATSAAATVTQPATHNCQPKETVAFSCELHDHQLVSLCVSSEFMAFQGEPKDNPGYAYLAIGSPSGETLHTFPENPREYKKYMAMGVTLSGWPYVTVGAEKGHFFYANSNIEIPVSVTAENLPAGWKVAPSPTREASYCIQTMHRENFENALLQLPRTMK